MEIFNKIQAAGNTVVLVTHEEDISRICASCGAGSGMALSKPTNEEKAYLNLLL